MPLTAHSRDLDIEVPAPSRMARLRAWIARDFVRERMIVLGDLWADMDGAWSGSGVVIRWELPGFLRRWGWRQLERGRPRGTGRDDISDVLLSSLAIHPSVLGALPPQLRRFVIDVADTAPQLTWTDDGLEDKT